MIDYFPLPDGRLLHPYEIVSRLVWGPAEWLRQYQLVQERRDRVVLYAVVADPRLPASGWRRSSAPCGRPWGTAWSS